MPDEIKRVSGERLLRLFERARLLRFSGVGRPAWVEQNLDRISAVFLRPLMPEGTPQRPGTCWRCCALVVVAGEGLRFFGVDIEHGDFDALPNADLSWDVAATLEQAAHYVPLPE
ncbi:hypothetical protein [Actinokineospora bangkokensis]|uniref:hypothetical protein n=1 Tax=Actinokineospora bangkokensis TaxID=1193682 RepID=UPI001178BB9D|nr:hypothetical protein [Actinokineospora bangkokensis]